MLALRVYVFLGAFLLFSMEPLVGRLLLPEFGGAFHVWTTSLMFFQAVLFLAYAWAHLVAPKIGRAQAIVVLLPLLFVPPSPGEILPDHDVPALLWALVRASALPFFALATTSVTAQAWLARSSLPGKESPYFLYALSNVGSLAALLVYAALVEPFVGVSVQRWVWAAGFVAWVIAALAAWRATEGQAAAPAPSATSAHPLETAYWIALAACPSALLMAVTNLIALDAGNVPLVWVVPLALYLLTFVWAFATPKPGEMTRVPLAVLRIWPHFAAVGLFFWSGADTGSTWLEVLLHAGIFFVVALAAHTELYRVRPPPAELTRYYLVLSFGGWVGGAFVALLAPVAFDGLFEYPIAIAALALAMLAWNREAVRAWFRGAGIPAIGISVALVLVIGWKVAEGAASGEGSERVLETDRSFYGIYRVIDTRRSGVLTRDLVSGVTCHGRQFLEEEMRREPLSYYHRTGPLGDVVVTLRDLRPDPADRRLRIGAIGLGVGATAAYTEPGDELVFFEIDALDVRLAEQHFTYLADARGDVRTVVADGRLALAAMTDAPAWDLLLVDAFSGDAIPTHLVTREAVELDRRMVGPGGALLFHVSNRYYDLLPVLARIAEELGVPAAYERHLDRLMPGQDPSVYFVFAPDEAFVRLLEPAGWVPVTPELAARSALWTDDHVNTLAALLPDWR